MAQENDIQPSHTFDALPDVLKYLKDIGKKISKTDLYRKHNEGMLRRRDDGKFHIEDVDKFAKKLPWKATGKRDREAFEITQQEKQDRASEHIRLKNEHLLLKLGKEYKLLLPAHEVRAAVFTMMRTVRDSLLTIPARIAPIVAAEYDQTKVEEILAGEIQNVLKELSECKNHPICSGKS